jgi:isopentenyl phosphate kinase
MPLTGLTFLKLGGSLITDKNRTQSPQRDVIRRLGDEIGTAWRQNPELSLVIGHGSGSYGHMTAKKYGTRAGVSGKEQWKGFAEVWRDARLLNQIMIESLAEGGLPVIAFPPSASVITTGGQVCSWDLNAIQSALQAHLIPVLNGDVVFDTRLGGTILSTEDVFSYLARHLHPDRILLAGIEPGVWADFPDCTQIIPLITPGILPQVISGLKGSAGIDVTGGMEQKVRSMVSLAQEQPGLVISIFSGLEKSLVRSVLGGFSAGTQLTA